MSTKKKFGNKKFINKSPEEIHRILADAWLGITVEESKLSNPLNWPPQFASEPEIYLSYVMTRPEYFSFICKEILNITLLPIQAVMLKTLWEYKFPMLIASRGFGKSFIEGVYNILRMLLLPKRKIVITGGGFRQAKVVFDYMETIWHNAPLLRSIVASGSNPDSMGPKHMADMYTFRIADRICYAVPTGPSGDKVRGLRANDLIAEEFNSHSKVIFETVMAGFTAVSANPIENVKRRAMSKLAEQYGIEIEETTDDYLKDNQLIISGTPGYTFQHFFQYWQDWKDIINSQGDPKKLGRYLERRNSEFGDNEDDVLSNLNWKDFAIIRIPFELIPKGFMDEAQVARAKATMHSGTYASEYAATFCDDSNGFFSRRLIESVVASPTNNIELPSGKTVFEGKVAGNAQRQYVFGIDPASEVDNFAITVIEMWPDHRRLVYCWTTNDKQHKEEMKHGMTKELDFYSYCARKIRWLMKVFPCARIMMDSQGGGKAVYERLHDPDKLQPGEQLIWEVIDEAKEKETDHRAGPHILELCQFSSADWVAEANHGLRFDMESKTLLFPFFDALSLIKANANDGFNTNRLYDTLEFCMEEIEELKNELSNIIISQTINGRDRWDTPETKMPGGKKGRMRKDRYSALLMANYGARKIFLSNDMKIEMPFGGFSAKHKGEKGPSFIGNEFWSQALSSAYSHY
jgi:hypothetical protein